MRVSIFILLAICAEAKSLFLARIIFWRGTKTRVASMRLHGVRHTGLPIKSVGGVRRNGKTLFSMFDLCDIRN